MNGCCNSNLLQLILNSKSIGRQQPSNLFSLEEKNWLWNHWNRIITDEPQHETLVTRFYIYNLIKQILTFYDNYKFFFFFFNFRKKRKLNFINFYFVFSISVLFPTFPPLFPTFPLSFPTFPPHSPHSHRNSPHFYPDFPHSHHSSHSIPRFPITAFTDSRKMWLNKIWETDLDMNYFQEIAI